MPHADFIIGNNSTHSQLPEIDVKTHIGKLANLAQNLPTLSIRISSLEDKLLINCEGLVVTYRGGARGRGCW